MALHDDAGDTGNLLDDYFTEDALAAELGVSRKTIRNWRALGEAPPVTRIGKRIYYAKDDAREWLRSCRVEAV